MKPTFSARTRVSSLVLSRATFSPSSQIHRHTRGSGRKKISPATPPTSPPHPPHKQKSPPNTPPPRGFPRHKHRNQTIRRPQRLHDGEIAPPVKHPSHQRRQHAQRSRAHDECRRREQRRPRFAQDISLAFGHLPHRSYIRVRQIRLQLLEQGSHLFRRPTRRNLHHRRRNSRPRLKILQPHIHPAVFASPRANRAHRRNANVVSLEIQTERSIARSQKPSRPHTHQNLPPSLRPRRNRPPRIQSATQLKISSRHHDLTILYVPSDGISERHSHPPAKHRRLNRADFLPR